MKLASLFLAFFDFILNLLLVAGAGVLALMMFLTVIDVVGRYVFNMPIDGGFELVEFMMAIFVPCALVYCQKKDSHITVDLLVERFPKGLQRIIAIITSLLTVMYFAMICWQSYLAIGEELANQLTSSVLLIPIYPFFVPLLVAFGMLTILLLVSFIKTVTASHRG